MGAQRTRLHQPGQTMQRSSSLTMEAVRDLSSTLWTIRTNQETSRIYRTTHSILRFFLFFDICYLISGIALVTMALANQMEERNRMVVYGGLFGLFASVSAVCNFLASHGLRTWRRGFLLPWLLFFLLVIGLLTMNIIRDLWCHHIQWRHVFLFFATMFIFTSWRHMQSSSWSCPCPAPSRSAPTLKQSYARRSNLSLSSSRRTLPHAMKRSRQRNCLQVMTRPPEDRHMGQLYLETSLAMTESLIYKTSYNTYFRWIME